MVSKRIFAGLFVAVFIFGILEDAATADDSAAAVPHDSEKTTATGAIAGTVRYASDTKRPWRYGRIYVKKAASETIGPLAEAVVCLSGARLKDASPVDAKTIVVDQKDMQFTPETTALRAGDRVKFTNSDPSTHNVHSDSPLHRFDVTIAQEEEAVETFPRAGGSRVPVALGCTFHGHMRAWIYVFDHPYFGMTGSDGRFRLERVPAGEYRLEVVHPAGELRASRTVVVRAGETLDVDIALSPDNLFKSKP